MMVRVKGIMSTTDGHEYSKNQSVYVRLCVVPPV